MRGKKKVYSFRFDETMIEKMKSFAHKENRNLSNFVETILWEKLAQLQAEQEKIHVDTTEK